MSRNILGPGNQNGVSFFNNMYIASTVAGHAIIGNTIYNANSAGINIGSISSAVAFSPTQDSYIIGNNLTNNCITVDATTKNFGTTVFKRGVGTNGPAFGMLITNHFDSDGLDNSLWTLTSSGVSLVGGLVVTDPLYRMKYADTTKSRYPLPTLSSSLAKNTNGNSLPINGTINITGASWTFGYLLPGATSPTQDSKSNCVQSFALECSAIQCFIDKYFTPSTPVTSPDSLPGTKTNY